MDVLYVNKSNGLLQKSIVSADTVNEVVVLVMIRC